MSQAADYQNFKRLDRMSSPKDLAATPADILGPFYRPGAPFRNRLVSVPSLVLSGCVLYTDGSPVDGYVEFWQADASGQYDENGPNFRGIQRIATDGRYILFTERPGDYDISPPSEQGPHEFRCAHLHVKVWVHGRDVLTTQLYFPDDKYNATDHWFDQRRVMAQGVTPGDWSFDLVIHKAD